jgi:hypothetical protein
VILRGLLLTSVLVVLTGCGPSVKGLCDDLSDECTEPVPEADCRDQGEDLEDRAEAAGCEDVFDAYLECLDAELCGWREGCATVRDDLDACLEGG